MIDERKLWIQAIGWMIGALGVGAIIGLCLWLIPAITFVTLIALGSIVAIVFTIWVLKEMLVIQATWNNIADLLDEHEQMVEEIKKQLQESASSKGGKG